MNKRAWSFLLFLGLLACSSSYAQSYVMVANTATPVNLTLCVGNVSSPVYFHYSAGSGYTTVVNGATYSGSAVDTTDLPAGQGCQQFSVRTSGVAANNTTAFFQVSGCHDYPLPSGKTCDGGLWHYGVLASPTPVLTASPSTTITTEGTSAVTISATQYNGTTSGPPIVGLTITATCTTQNGAQASASPSSAVTNAQGTASFQIATSGLRYAAPGSTPSGSCTFSASGSTQNAVIQIQGTFVGGNLSLSQGTMNNTGTSTLTATISTGVPNTPINASCSQSVYSVSVSPSTVNSDANGRATFTVTATRLYIYDPSGSVPTAPYCSFKIGSTGSSANLQFSAGNACTFGLQPQPSQCG